MKTIQLDHWAFKSHMGVAEAMCRLREIPRRHVAEVKAREFIAWNFGTRDEHHDTLLGNPPDWVRENAARLIREDYDPHSPNGFTAGVIAGQLAGFKLAA